jgi:uncharacterized protein (DUF362 family)/NAD-dependent dihydropyrimidine dehydrogenase PreA subunit
MERSTVAIERCAGYDPEGVYHALKRGVQRLGGIEQFVRPGERILLKPNILAREAPEKAVTTHPTVLAGCVRLFQEAGAGVVFGDSPGLERASRAAEGSDLLRAGTEGGAAYDPFDVPRALPNPNGTLVSDFPVASVVHGVDGIVNLPKFKTHQLTRVTGAVKNLFGSISGRRKAMYHVQFPDVTDFCRFLVELNLRLRPRLHVMDAVVAMEGNGPRSGTPVPIGALILSADPVAVDATACRLAALDPSYVPTTVLGAEMGLGRWEEGGIAVVGAPLDGLIRPRFEVVRKPVYSNATYAYYGAIKNLVLPRPAIDEGRCVRCGRCVEACPVPGKALDWRDGQRNGEPPIYCYDACIRCYCCQEMCPKQAIDRRTPLLGRILRVA